MFNRVLVGLEDSPSARLAVKNALKSARKLSVPAVGVFVVEDKLADGEFLKEVLKALSLQYHPSQRKEILSYLERKGDRLLEEFASEGRKEGVAVSLVQLSGEAGRELSGEADGEDLLFLGKRNYPSRSLGSTALYCACFSPCPLFLAEEGAEEPKKALLLAKEKLPSERLEAFRELFSFDLYAPFPLKEAKEVKDPLRFLREEKPQLVISTKEFLPRLFGIKAHLLLL